MEIAVSAEFRPYIKKTLGQVSNPNTRYFIGEGEVRIYKSLFGSLERIDRSLPIGPATAIDASRTNIMGYGDVVVSTETQSVTFERVAEVKRFIAAIEREKQVANPWHKGLTDADLARCSIIIPSPSKLLEYLYQGTHGGIYAWYNVTRRYDCKVGDWIREGVVIGRGETPSKIVAPCSGKIRHIGGFSCAGGWDVETGWARSNWRYGFRSRLSEMAFALIQPLKGSSVPDSYVQTAYSETIRDSEASISILHKMSDKQVRRQFHNNFRYGETPAHVVKVLTDEAHTALTMLKEAKPHRVVGLSIEEMPESPTEQWILENAPTAGIPFTAA
jgi:hypothetical protein